MCVASALTYGSETWADHCENQVEIIYRTGLRTALGIRSNINNEIVYVESGKYPLKCRISKLQLKFWLSIEDYTSRCPDSALNHLLIVANELNLPYIRWYKNLVALHVSPAGCQNNLQMQFREKWKATFQDGANDTDSRLGTYCLINPNLSIPGYMGKTMLETDRLILTRFRCGSHSLMVEKGRQCNIPRDERLCPCGTGIQTVVHCFTDCTLIVPTLEKRYTNLLEVFSDDDICVMLHKVCMILKVPV